MNSHSDRLSADSLQKFTHTHTCTIGSSSQIYACCYDSGLFTDFGEILSRCQNLEKIKNVVCKYLKILKNKMGHTNVNLHNRYFINDSKK